MLIKWKFHPKKNYICEWPSLFHKVTKERFLTISYKPTHGKAIPMFVINEISNFALSHWWDHAPMKTRTPWFDIDAPDYTKSKRQHGTWQKPSSFIHWFKKAKVASKVRPWFLKVHTIKITGHIKYFLSTY